MSLVWNEYVLRLGNFVKGTWSAVLQNWHWAVTNMITGTTSSRLTWTLFVRCWWTLSPSCHVLFINLFTCPCSGDWTGVFFPHGWLTGHVNRFFLWNTMTSQEFSVGFLSVGVSFFLWTGYQWNMERSQFFILHTLLRDSLRCVVLIEHVFMIYIAAFFEICQLLFNNYCGDCFLWFGGDIL